MQRNLERLSSKSLMSERSLNRDLRVNLRHTQGWSTSGRDRKSLLSTRLSYTTASYLSTEIKSDVDLDVASTQETGPPVFEGNLRLVNTISTEQELFCCKASKETNLLALGLSDGSIKVVDYVQGNHVQTMSHEEKVDIPLPVTCLRFLPPPPDSPQLQQLFLAAYAQGWIKLWNSLSGDCLFTLSEDQQTLAITVNPNFSKMASAGSDARIRIYDLETQQILEVLQASESMDVMDGHRQRIFAAKYHPYAPHELVSGGWDDTLQFWDDRTPHAVRRILGPHICGEGLDLDKDGIKILTASWRKNNPLEIWDYLSGQLIQNVKTDNYVSYLYCCQWVGKDYLISGGGNKNLLRVIDRRTQMTASSVRNLPGAVYSLDSLKHNEKTAFSVAVACATSCYILELPK